MQQESDPTIKPTMIKRSQASEATSAVASSRLRTLSYFPKITEVLCEIPSEEAALTSQISSHRMAASRNLKQRKRKAKEVM